MLKGFRDFILRGNVVDLAVGVVIGGAFGAIVTALVKDLITPLIAAIVGKPDFSAIGFDIGTTHFPVGDFINACVAFILVAAAIYFFVVVPVNALMGACQARRNAARPHNQKLPRMPERNSHCRAQMRLLHIGRCLVPIHPARYNVTRWHSYWLE